MRMKDLTERSVILELGKVVLYPLSIIYGLSTFIRNKLYDYKILSIYKSNLPVISVGNITVGGNGKTPVCIYLSEELKKRALHPVILSRGYKGATIGPSIVSFFDSATDVGDEPKLMSKLGHTVIVAKDRVKGAKFIEQRDLGDVIILDDGFQHRRLGRDFDIACFDVASDKAVKDVIKGQLLPCGKLRENLRRGIKRAGAIIFSLGSDPKAGEERAHRVTQFLNVSALPFYYEIKFLGVFNALSSELLPPGRIVAFSALAKPQNFLDSLKNLNFNVVKSYSFSDHYEFSIAEMTKIFKEANYPIVCTEKDAVKLGDDFFNLMKNHLKSLYILKIKAELRNSDEFFKLIGKRCQIQF